MNEVHEPGAGETAADTAGRSIGVTFRAEPGRLLAGGPVSLVVTITLEDGEAGRLIAGAARATGRSREYSFAGASPGGTPLRDPYADAVEVGGVQTAQLLDAGEPVVERVLLNQFLTLEDVLQDVADGGSIDLAVDATRQIHFEGSSDDDVADATATVSLTLRRDDAALATYYREAAEEVMAATQVQVRREALVTELCTARNASAAAALTTLTGHSDASVAARARQALSAL